MTSNEIDPQTETREEYRNKYHLLAYGSNGNGHPI